MKSDRRSLIVGSLAAGLVATGLAARTGAQAAPAATGGKLPGSQPRPDETLELWQDGAPGMPEPAPEEAVIERSTDPQFPDRALTGIVRPRLDVFRPQQPNGAAVMISPGGGYQRVVIDKEGYELGQWLSARGVTAFVLFYRLPGEGWAQAPDVALSDAQRAIRLIRQRAGEYGVDPERVAAMGFSAGGHLCADLATRFNAPVYEAVDDADALPARPMLAAPIYPVISMSPTVAHTGSRDRLIGADADAALERAHSPDFNVTDDTPPCFLVHAEDDGSVPVDNTLLFRAALHERGIPVETHLFTHGGHGFGLRRAAGKPASVWPELYLSWAQSMGLF